MSIILPPQVQMDLEREAFADEQTEIAKEFNGQLKSLDGRLSLVWIRDDAPAYGGLVPGRWHVRRRNDRGPDSYMAITGPNGEYMRPHSGIYFQLQEMDTWRGSVTEKLWKQRNRAAQEKAKRTETERAERAEELADRIHALEPGVSFTNAGKWTYRAGKARHG